MRKAVIKSKKTAVDLCYRITEIIFYFSMIKLFLEKLFKGKLDNPFTWTALYKFAIIQ
ncbi:hypothetical protein CLU99_1734 [Flavobacterium sp. 2]|nr:hypothetical protein CLU99_1734 [Flavobacterium sp. 2]